MIMIHCIGRHVALAIFATFLIIVCVGTNTQCHASEQWQPSEHIAIIEREINGYSEAIHTMDIASLVHGRIIKIMIDVGDVCTESSIIILDPTSPTIDLKIAQEQLTQGELQVQQSLAQLKLAQANVLFQGTEHQRMVQLKDRGVNSREKFSTSEMALTRARLAVQAQKIAVQQSRQEYAVLAQYVRRSQNTLDKYSLQLPVGWTVSKRYVHPGSFVAAGQAIVRISDTRTLIARVVLSESEVDALQTMDTITLAFAQQDARVAARIKSISPDFIAQSRKRDVTLVFPASTLGVHARSGFNYTLRIPVTDPYHVRIPKHFVETRFGQSRVCDQQGVWHPIVSSRTDAENFIIPAQQLSQHIILVIPQSDK